MIVSIQCATTKNDANSSGTCIPKKLCVGLQRLVTRCFRDVNKLSGLSYVQGTEKMAVIALHLRSG